MNFFHRMPWPLPALFTWAAAWAIFAAASRVWPWWLALLVACVMGTAASLMAPSWWRRVMVAAGFPVSFLALSAQQLPAWGWLLPLGLLLMVYPLNAWRDAPLFPTPRGALDELGALLPLPEGAQGLDAGCGVGDGLRALRSAWPQVQWHGIEWSWPLRAVCALRCPWAKVRQGDIWAADWSQFDVVYLFQRPETMGRAAIKAQGEMGDGRWLVSLNFELPDVTPTLQTQLPDGRGVYAYQLPWVQIEHDSVQANEVAGLLPQREAGVWVKDQQLYPRRRTPRVRH